MKFFVPFSKNKQQAFEVYDGIVKFNKEQLGREIINRKIYSIYYKHDNKYFTAKVGDQEPRTGEIVVAILESDILFYICTPNRGVVRGEPILVGKVEIISVSEFSR